MHYTSGSVRVVTGSQTVKGNSTNFVTYVSAGNYFRLANESTWYNVAAVVDATELTLSGRYANTSYQTSRSAEHNATVNTATQIYSGTLSYTPAIRNSVVLTASIERFTDDGAGVLTSNQSGSGTISYDDGSWSVVLGTVLATSNLVASYYSGDTRNGLSYQITRDYTNNYNIPEMSPNDVGFTQLYTKAVRLIDSNMYNASANTVKVSSYFKMGGHQYLLFGINNTEATIVANATAVDASCKGSLYVSSAGTLWILDSDTSATRFKTS